MTIEVILTPGQQAIEMTREQLEELIREEKVGLEAVLRDEWTHPNWKAVFRIPRFRRAVTSDSRLGRQWQKEKDAAMQRKKAMWPARFDSPLESILGIEKWEYLGWDFPECRAASRLSIYEPMRGYAWVMTFQWVKDSIVAELRSEQQQLDGRIPNGDLPELLSDVFALPMVMGPLGPTGPGLDGYTYVHRFASNDTALTSCWWTPNERNNPHHIQLLAAYADIARQLGFAARPLT